MCQTISGLLICLTVTVFAKPSGIVGWTISLECSCCIVGALSRLLVHWQQFACSLRCPKQALPSLLVR